MKRMLNVIGSSMIADCEQQEAGIGPIYVTSKKYKIIFSHLSKLHVMNTVAAIPQCHFDINDWWLNNGVRLISCNFWANVKNDM